MIGHSGDRIKINVIETELDLLIRATKVARPINIKSLIYFTFRFSPFCKILLIYHVCPQNSSQSIAYYLSKFTLKVVYKTVFSPECRSNFTISVFDLLHGYYYVLLKLTDN